MNKLFLLFALSLAYADDCSLCPGGSSSIGNTNASLLPGSSGETCGEKEALAAAASSADCSSVVAGINSGINYSAFCCVDVQPDINACPFCEQGFIDFNQEILTRPLSQYDFY